MRLVVLSLRSEKLVVASLCTSEMLGLVKLRR